MRAAHVIGLLVLAAAVVGLSGAYGGSNGARAGARHDSTALEKCANDAGGHSSMESPRSNACSAATRPPEHENPAGELDAQPSGSVMLVGDSLNVGIEPYLADRLDGWTISTDDAVGRSGARGLAELQAMGSGLSPTVVISLGTNDAPTEVTDFQNLVEAVVAQAGPRRCVIWSTIWRDGPNLAFNAILREAAARHPNLEVADWAVLVSMNPGLLRADGVHATPDGYATKATQVAQLVERCANATSVILRIQKTLTRYGYHTGPIDGVYGAQTTRAVEELQTDLGVTVDGRVGPETVKAFDEAVANRDIQPTTG